MINIHNAVNVCYIQRAFLFKVILSLKVEHQLRVTNSQSYTGVRESNKIYFIINRLYFILQLKNYIF